MIDITSFRKCHLHSCSPSLGVSSFCRRAGICPAVYSTEDGDRGVPVKAEVMIRGQINSMIQSTPTTKMMATQPMVCLQSAAPSASGFAFAAEAAHLTPAASWTPPGAVPCPQAEEAALVCPSAGAPLASGKGFWSLASPPSVGRRVPRASRGHFCRRRGLPWDGFAGRRTPPSGTN